MAETSIQAEQPQPMSPWSFFLISFSISLFWLRAYSESGMHNDPFGAMGRALGDATIPFLVSYALRGRKKKRDWNSFARWFFWLALLVHFSLTYGNQQFAAKRRAELELVRPFVQEAAALQSRYMSDPRCDFEPPLYSAASFVNRESIGRSIAQLKACVTLNKEMETEVDRLLQRMEASARSSFTSPEYREDALRRIREGFQSTMAERQLAASSLQRWEEETTALYDFAARSADWIHVRNEEILIEDDAILTQFNRMLEAANEAQAELIKVQTRMQAAGQAETEKLKQMLK